MHGWWHVVIVSAILKNHLKSVLGTGNVCSRSNGVVKFPNEAFSGKIRVFEAAHEIEMDRKEKRLPKYKHMSPSNSWDRNKENLNGLRDRIKTSILRSHMGRKIWKVMFEYIHQEKEKIKNLSGTLKVSMS